MPLVCSTCGQSKWRSEFSRRHRDSEERVCRACRDVRDKDEREARRVATQNGQRVCRKCGRTLPLSEFSPKKARCKACCSKYVREARDAMEHAHLGDGSRGDPQSGYRCSICEQTKAIEEFSLKQTYFDYRCKQCLAKKAEEYRKTPVGKFNAAKSVAVRRNIGWNITMDEYLGLLRLPCHYCGHPLRGSGIGLDRLDCDGDYAMSNCVPCCMECNLVRGAIFTPEEMIVLGKAVRAVKNARLRQGIPLSTNGWGRPKKYADSEHDRP